MSRANMKHSIFSSLTLLCALPLLISTGFTAPIAAAPTVTTAGQEAKKLRAISDDNDLRTIEAMTDRDETVAQFFVRQKLVLVDNANTDGKFWSVDQIVKGEASHVFVSYPLQNDQGFRLYRYGDFYALEKPAPAVAALFARDSNWKNSMLILSLSTDDSATKDDLNKGARVIGRIFIKDRERWRPELDAESLKYQEPDEATDEN